MRLKKYNGGKILAPLKCGTRFLDETFGGDDGSIGMSDLFRKRDIPNIEVIVIRSPYEHLISALHTEILGVYNNGDTEHPFDDVKTIVEKFTIKNNNLESGTHWSGHLYKNLYFLWIRNKDKIKIIQLKDLSDYLKSINIKTPTYNPNKYNFNYYDNWHSKEDIVIYLKTTFPNEWGDFMRQVEDCDKYYKLLIGEVVDEVKFI